MTRYGLGAGPVWRRGSRCESGACVEVAMVNGGAAMRDSKVPDGPHLVFDASEWTGFLSAIKAGLYDRE